MAAAFLLLAPWASAQTNWVLVWSDEFNGPAGPFTPTSANNQFWTFETGKGVFGTGEIEQMVNDGSTSFLDGNGHLVIKTFLQNGTYFSARIKTQLNGSFGKEFTYGRVEARIQIPTSQAIWPAFWMMGDNGVTWPGRGEIDIMENNGAKPTQIKGTIHGIGYANTGLGVHFNSPDGVTPFANGFHIFGMIWTPFQIQFYVDDPTNIYATMTPGDIMGVGNDPTNNASTLGQWDFWGHPFFILFDVAVGGGFVGPPGANTVVPQFMNIDYVRLYQAATPAGPTSLVATANANSQVQLNWNASTTNDPAITYNVFRSTTQGAAHNISNTNMTNMIATGVTGNSFTDVMLTPGTTYFYQISATSQGSGESTLSNESSVTTPSTGTNVQAIAISSGSLVGTNNFVQDTGFALGASNAVPDAIDVTGVTNPAPQGVYRTERWGPTTYTIPNLSPGGNFTVRLHFNETAVTAAAQRSFNVAINGTTVLTNFDIFATAGAAFKALVKEFPATADSTGKITIAFTKGTNGAPHTNPSIRGIEIIPVGGCTAPTSPSGLMATPVSASEIDLGWTAATGPSCGGSVTYKVTRNGATVATGLAGTTFNDTGLAASTTYTYSVSAVNSVGSSSPITVTATTPAGGCSVPTTPTNFTATAVSTSEIDLSWTASTGPSCGGAVTYNVTRNGAQIGSGLAATSLKDTGLASGTAFNYTVAAVNSSGSSATASASATTQGGNVVRINSGGPAVSPFAADVDFVGGGTINHANTIDLSGVTNPAPMVVYQSARVGNFTYTIPGFAAGSSHTVRLHFAETFFSTAGSRTFNVSINGTQVLSAFDIFTAAGAKNKAIIKQFTATANSSGQIVIQFTTVVNQSLVSGIEVQ
jgi:beta-glucanase (GH16 family)